MGGATGTASAGGGRTRRALAPGGIEAVDFSTPGNEGTGCGMAPDKTGTTLPYNGMTFYKRAVAFTGKGGASLMGEYLIALPANCASGEV